MKVRPGITKATLREVRPSHSQGFEQTPSEFVITTCVTNAADIYLFKVSNSSTRKRSEICSMLTIKTPERRQ